MALLAAQKGSGGGSILDFKNARFLSNTVAGNATPSISFADKGTPTFVYFQFDVNNAHTRYISYTNVNPNTGEIDNTNIWKADTNVSNGEWAQFTSGDLVVTSTSVSGDGFTISSSSQTVIWVIGVN